MENPNKLRIPRSKEVAVGIASLALLGSGSSAEAYEAKPKQTVSGVADKLERKIESCKRVSFDPNMDAYWSRSDYAGEGYQFATQAPLVANVNGKQRLFRIRFKQHDADKDIDVKVIPRNALRVQSAVTYGPPANQQYTTYKIETTSDVLELHPEKHTAEAHVQREDGQDFDMPIGKTRYHGHEVVI
jgi:hypothetical protein